MSSEVVMKRFVRTTTGLEAASTGDLRMACHAGQYSCAMHDMLPGEAVYTRILVMVKTQAVRAAVSTGKRGAHV